MLRTYRTYIEAQQRGNRRIAYFAGYLSRNVLAPAFDPGLNGCKHCGEMVVPCGRSPEDGHWHHMYGNHGRAATCPGAEPLVAKA